MFVEVALTREIAAAIHCCSPRGADPAAPGRRSPPSSTRSPIPSRACGWIIRRFPDQAGGRGVLARSSAPQELRHPVAGARLRQLAQPGTQANPRLPASRGSTSNRCRRCQSGSKKTRRGPERLKPILLELAAGLPARQGQRRKPVDPVARFHLRNEARLEWLDWLSDNSPGNSARRNG